MNIDFVHQMFLLFDIPFSHFALHYYYDDVDVDDDDAYYANANERYDRLKAYDASTQNFRDALNLDSEKAGTFNEMIVAASEHPDFDPVLWMVENAGLDVESMLGDPEYSQKLGEARAKYLEQISEGEELSRQFEENAPKSMEELNAWCEENDVDNETKRSVIEKMYSLMDDLMVGKLPLDFFDLCYKGMTHDDDVDMAKEAGKAEGRSQKVSEKLRKVGGIPRIGGRQSSVSDAPSLDQNMFGL